MALDTVFYPQDSHGYLWGYEFGFQEEDKDGDGLICSTKIEEQGLHANLDSSSSSLIPNLKEWDHNSSPEAVMDAPVVSSGRRKRRRTRSCKGKEELENQRMTHIAVERNRRKQMNEYLAVIRSVMPASYVQRGDQASIIGGAINYVKELEQHLQILEAQKQITQLPNNGLPSLFTDFFTFPQYSTQPHSNNSPSGANDPLSANRPSAFADIEVTMAESHANLKILSKRRPRQLLNLVAGLQCLWLAVLHLNVTTVDQQVLYSLSLKVEDGCQLTTVDEIADAVNHLLGRIQEETNLG